MKTPHIPDPLYNILPYLYLGIGVVTLLALSDWIALVSGLTLISAGGTIWMMRYRYRRAYLRSDGRIEVPAEVGGNLIHIAWKSSFESGHAVIDAQHRRLFGLGNELIGAVSSNKPTGDVAWLLDELVEHIADHFITEEAVLARAKRPISKERQETHRSLLAKAASLRDRYHNGQAVSSELVGFIVYDVITDHITKQDLKFVGKAR